MGFDVEQLRKVMVTDQGDIKLLTARGHRDLFVFGAISATEYVQLCLDSRVCITELSCLLVERRGALAEARDASAGMPAPQ